MSPIVLDLSDSKEYLHALKVAENFPALFDFELYCESRNLPASKELEEAMAIIDEWCPWLWPQIDRYVLARVAA